MKVSDQVKEVRNKLTDLRTDISRIMSENPDMAFQIEHFDGYLTVGISSMFLAVDAIKYKEDHE